MPRKKKTASKRNMVVYTMIMRSAKAGRHPDRKKQASKRACRGKHKLP
jgi:hypothetical protein